MDNRPLGVFDSGLGGLTAVKCIRSALPGEDIIYFGDTGRVPYGGRSKDTLLKYTRQDIAFLLRHDIKAIVVACGTVSSTALDTVAPEYSLPIFGVVHPAAQSAVRASRSGRIGLIGTSASINSGAYERAIHALRPEAKIYSAACPLFVPLVENGRFHRGDAVIEQIAREYLAPLRDEGSDTLILGCTHYPLLEDVIGDFMGADVKLISPGAETAFSLARELTDRDLLSGRGSGGKCSFYVSDDPAGFAPLASVFLGSDIGDQVSKVDIDRF